MSKHTKSRELMLIPSSRIFMQQPHLSCLHGTFNPPGAAENIGTSEDPDTFFLLSFIPFKKSLRNSNAPPSVHWLFTPNGPRYSRNQPTKQNFFPPLPANWRSV